MVWTPTEQETKKLLSSGEAQRLLEETQAALAEAVKASDLPAFENLATKAKFYEASVDEAVSREADEAAAAARAERDAHRPAAEAAIRAIDPRLYFADEVRDYFEACRAIHRVQAGIARKLDEYFASHEDVHVLSRKAGLSYQPISSNRASFAQDLLTSYLTRAVNEADLPQHAMVAVHVPAIHAVQGGQRYGMPETPFGLPPLADEADNQKVSATVSFEPYESRLS